MTSLFQIDLLAMILKGILIGIIASAPMGPVGILCIQRTLNKGRWYGFVTGVGAAISDIIYAMITGFGMSFVVNFINNPRYKFYLQIAGSVMLFFFGLYTFMTKPKKQLHKSAKQKGSLWHNGITAFLVTFSNPLIIFLFMSTFALFAFVIPHHPLEMILGFASIIFGALLWWYGLTWLVDKIRNKFDETGIQIINRIIGTLVIIFSLVVIIGTAFNLYQLPSF
ncbi:MAG: LysE family translocator [Prevotella sp.]|jgi:threonine/homoserine/homoserine lactone efflux protein